MCYIHLNPVRAGLAKGPERYFYSGHNGDLLNGAPKVLDAGPILKILGGKKAYEKFVMEGVSESHNEKYYAVEDQRFLGEEGFGEEIRCGAGGESRTQGEEIDRSGFQGNYAAAQHHA